MDDKGIKAKGFSTIIATPFSDLTGVAIITTLHTQIHDTRIS